MEDVKETGSSILEKKQDGKEKFLSLMDMPDFVLDRIIELLPPESLCRMASVCKGLRARCTRDYLWERLLKKKWSKLIDEASYIKWQSYVTCRSKLNFLKDMTTKQPSSSSSSDQKWTLSSIRSTLRSYVTNDSVMAFYFAIENGKFWFPAQMYDHELCYDVEARYNSHTNTFITREISGAVIEEDNGWERLRAPLLNTCSYESSKSYERLHALKPGDHIEIQWRPTQNSDYGWWYAVVGHLDSCDPNDGQCQCNYNNSDIVVVEFRQYPVGSRWRRTRINKSNGTELGGEGNHGFYGEIRKLYEQEEISLWQGMCRYVV